jgi:hypothetical protein
MMNKLKLVVALSILAFCGNLFGEEVIEKIENTFFVKETIVVEWEPLLLCPAVYKKTIVNGSIEFVPTFPEELCYVAGENDESS